MDFFSVHLDFVGILNSFSAQLDCLRKVQAAAQPPGAISEHSFAWSNLSNSAVLSQERKALVQVCGAVFGATVKRSQGIASETAKTSSPMFC